MYSALDMYGHKVNFNDILCFSFYCVITNLCNFYIMGQFSSYYDNTLCWFCTNELLLMPLTIVTCRASDYLSALHSWSGLRSSRPERALCASKYTDMRNVFTMVYLTVGYLGELQYTMRNYNGLPDLSMDVDHKRLVWLSAPRLTSAEINSLEAVLIWPAAYLAHLLCVRPLRG